MKHYLDSLAKGGLLFSDAYSSSLVCSPSRAGLMTGKHPARIGLINFNPLTLNPI